MLKFIVVAAVVAFAVGIIVGTNSTSGNASLTEQVVSDAIPAESIAPQLTKTETDLLATLDSFSDELALLRMIESGIAQRSEEYEALNLEIVRLAVIKTALEKELGVVVSASLSESGQ